MQFDRLKEFDGDHERFLEESWHEDQRDHAAGHISHSDIHKRWFGDDSIEWLEELSKVFRGPTAYKNTWSRDHSIKQSVNIILIKDLFKCKIEDTFVAAQLFVQASLNARITTSFGLTIVATLGVPPDLSQSYLYFKSAGTVTAVFSIDALVRAHYRSGDIELFGLQNFGATFSIPGILTVVRLSCLKSVVDLLALTLETQGPNFKVYGSVDM